MATKDIKVGNFYHVLVKVLRIDPINGEITTETVNEFGTSLNMEPTYFARGEKEAFFPIIPENGTKNSEPAPKYDPCRLFKKGDEVEYRPKDGRANPNLLVGRRYKVSADEPCDSAIVQVEFDGLRHLDTFVAYNHLQLVTPVEEIKQFYLESDNNMSFYIYFGTKRNYELVSRLDKKYYSLTDAFAEVDRLNAEYRKEQK